MIAMSTRPKFGDEYVPGRAPGPHRVPASRTRVFQHSQVQIKPLDGDTLHEASTCLVYENGQTVAQLKRCGQRFSWGVYPAGMTLPAVFGASALEAVTAWLSTRGGDTA